MAGVHYRGMGLGMQSGKIFFVGAGPGDAAFLAVKGKLVLSQADVVIYDRSVGDEIITLIPDNANRVYIGDFSEKEPKDIYGILTESANQGKCIVCLNGGPPFLFGNDRKYFKHLVNAHISFEVIPSVEAMQDDEELSRYTANPLSGWNIIVTRPRELGREISGKLRWHGARVFEIPTIFIKLVENDTIIDVVLKHIWDYQWIVFTSQIGVDAFFRHCRKRQMDARKLSACKFVAIGLETKRKLAACGIIADIVPESHTVAGLSKEITKIMHNGERVLVVRNRDTDRYLIQRIRRMRNALFEDLPVYEMVSKKLLDLPEGISIGSDFSSGKTIVVFSASIEVKGFMAMFKGYEVGKIRAVCIGDKTQKTAASYGMQTIAASDEMMADEVVKLVLSFIQQ